jgi:hypothetical protein
MVKCEFAVFVYSMLIFLLIVVVIVFVVIVIEFALYSLCVVCPSLFV